MLANSEDPDQTLRSDLGLTVCLCPKNGSLNVKKLILFFLLHVMIYN